MCGNGKFCGKFLLLLAIGIEGEDTDSLDSRGVLISAALLKSEESISVFILDGFVFISCTASTGGSIF